MLALIMEGAGQSLQVVQPAQPVWVLSKLAGASHLPSVVFPAWFSETGPLLGAPGSIGCFRAGAAGLEGAALVPATPVPM